MFTLGFDFGADAVRALYRELYGRLGWLTTPPISPGSSRT